MVNEQVKIEAAGELQTENVMRIDAEDRERVAAWCHENLKGPWQLICRAFSGEDQGAVTEAAQREAIREIRFTRGVEPPVFRFEIWELRVDDAEEAASAKLAL